MEFCAVNGRLQPGFRFHPTDEELVMYYLKRKVLGKRIEPGVITEVDIYKFHPQDLREIACMKKDLNWYFFCPKGKKYQNGVRTNRSTDSGYWKATGNDRDVSYQRRTVGKIKTLVFHLGKPPKGERTDWVMHEYRLEDANLADKGVFLDSYVLCKIFKKSGWGPKAGEQYGAPFIEEEWNDDDDDDENHNHAQMVQNEAKCAATSISVSVNACPGFTAEQGHSGAVSGSAVNQPHSPFSATAASANLASSSKGPMPRTKAADQATGSEGPSVCADPVVQASSLMGFVPNRDDDEIFSMLDVFIADDDLGDIFGSLPELDEKSLLWYESNLANFGGGGLDLSDLDGPM